MHTTDRTAELDKNVVEVLRQKIVHFVTETEGLEIAKATLRVADVEISRSQEEAYSLALRDEICPQFKDRLYYITVNDYTGRNGRRFADVSIEMKRGLLI